MKKDSKTFCRLIKKQIADEKHAKKEYGKLRRHAPGKGVKGAIGRIGVQEGKHRSKLTRMYRRLCT